jgi:hypothetical protein
MPSVEPCSVAHSKGHPLVLIIHKNALQGVKIAQGPSWHEVSSIEQVDAKVKEGARVVLFAGKEPRAASKVFAAFKSVAAKVLATPDIHHRSVAVRPSARVEDTRPSDRAAKDG